MVNKVIGFDCKTQGAKRPEFLSIKQYGVKIISKLIQIRATSEGGLTIKPDEKAAEAAASDALKVKKRTSTDSTKEKK